MLKFVGEILHSD